MGPFLDPSRAPFWEVIWPPDMLKPVSSAASGRPRAVPQLLFWGPGGVQERSKRPTGGKNKGPQERTIAKRPPRGFPDPLWSHLGRILEPSRDDFDNFGTSWGVVVCICRKVLRSCASGSTKWRGVRGEGSRGAAQGGRRIHDIRAYRRPRAPQDGPRAVPS